MFINAHWREYEMIKKEGGGFILVHVRIRTQMHRLVQIDTDILDRHR